MIALLKIYWLTLQITLLSFGGIYSFWAIFEREAVHDCAAARHGDAAVFEVCRDDYNTVFVLSKLVPGPHVNTAAILGYDRYGVPGMLAFLFGLLTPSLLLTPLLYRFYRRYGRHPALASFFRGASLAALAILVTFLLVILAGQFTGPPARLVVTGALFTLSFGLSYRHRLNPMLTVIGGGLFGFLFLQ